MNHSIFPESKTSENSSRDPEREQTILKHLRQVEILARRLRAKIPASVELGDLVSAGIVGLIDAVEKFDPSHDVKFKTFAEYRIRGAMLDSLRNLDWAPRNLRVTARKFQAVCGALEQSLGRVATEEEKCQALGISLSEFHRTTEFMVRMKIDSLESGINNEGENHLTNSTGILDSSSEIPSALYEKNETSNLIQEAIAGLPKRERLVVSLYYYEQVSMAKIGKILNVNESRISQVHANAMRRLKSKLHSINAAA